MNYFEKLALDRCGWGWRDGASVWDYNRLVDERNITKVWSDSRAHNYYWTEHGRSAVMNPFYTAEMSGFLREPALEDLAIA